MNKQRKKLAFPHTCALLFFVIVLAAVLTWIVPAGEFDTEKVGSVNKVIPGTYHLIDKNPQGPWDVMMAVVGGFQKASVLMVMVMFVGAAVQMVQRTGAIEVSFGKIAGGNKKNIPLIIFAVMLFMSIGGAAGVFANPLVALVPIGIILSTSLGLDKAAGMLIVYLGGYSGFNVGWANASTLGVAHPIAELPVFSGFYVRILLNVINFLLTYFFVMRYIKQIQKDPRRSLNYEPGRNPEEFMGLQDQPVLSDYQLHPRQMLSLVAMGLSVVMIIVGSIQWKWSNPQIAATFFTLCIAVGIINGLSVNELCDQFIQGCTTMLGAAFIIGFANGISIILSEGNILNTIVYAISLPMKSMGPVLGANFMYLANLFINLFIPSGSGQAAAVMPLMVPIADLAGITRQVAVQAFQFGDGFSNCIIPTAGTLMGCLGIASVPWNRYAKWFLPFLILQSIMAFAALTILQSTGWTGL